MLTKRGNIQTQVIDVHDELAGARVSNVHLKLGATMALLTLFDGFDTFNPAYVIQLGIGRVGAILGPYIGGVLQQFYRGQTALLLAIAIAAAGAAIAVLFARKRLVCRFASNMATATRPASDAIRG
jgi:uncharacterized membrane protein YeaQ/YmgE (transglycosylase-associated protein family)